MTELYARVVFDPLVAGLEKPLDYLVPPGLRGSVGPGQRVVVPLGKRRVEGLVVELTGCPDLPPGAAAKNVSGLVDRDPILGPALISLGLWLSERYLCSPGEAFRAIIPPGIRRSPRRRVGLARDAAGDRLGPGRGEEGRTVAQRELLAALGESAAGLVEVRELYRRAAGDSLTGERLKAYESALDSLVRKGICRIETDFEDGGRAKELTLWDLAAPLRDNHEAVEETALALQSRSPRQAAVLRLLASGALPSTEIQRRGGAGAEGLRALEKRGLVQRASVRVRRDPFSGRQFSYPAPAPTPDQEAALTEIVGRMGQREPGTVLLHGVTGSGKTEVYLQAIEACLASGRQALVLVPEIALTPQMIQRFRGRFGDRVAVLHSRLGAGERFDEWYRAASGEADIAIGARSGLFAPFNNIGLIVLDEEHENTYKQDEAPRYHAREAAGFLAKEHSALLVLGSATPSLESYFRASAGEIRLLSLPRRIGDRPLPPVEVVDMREELAEEHRGVISRPLAHGLKECLSGGHQAILFLNRRGHSTFVLCRDCGHSLRCPDCEVSLTFHQGQSKLNCHYCGHLEPLSSTCPACKGSRIRYFGTGTEKLEEELARLFPLARVARMDIDSTRAKGAHEEILGRLASGGIDVLVGTQMVAKGLDFPGVTLVGVVAADIALNLPDFRATERTFQLITQVAGRSGRGERPGLVLIQTYNPEHFAILAASRHDYQAFYEQEIKIRRELGFPPFTSLVSLVVWGQDHDLVGAEARRLAQALQDMGDPALVLGPVPAPMARLRGNWRQQILIKGPGIEKGTGIEALADRVKKALEAWKPKAAVSVTIDVNPQNML